jgi:hypothetical protein
MSKKVIVAASDWVFSVCLTVAFVMSVRTDATELAPLSLLVLLPIGQCQHKHTAKTNGIGWPTVIHRETPWRRR